MSDIRPELPDEGPEAVAHRLRRNLPLAVLALIVLVYGVSGWRTALSVAIGGALALFNYRWLRTSLAAMLDASVEKPVSAQPFKFILRWFAIGAVVIFATRVAPGAVVGIIIGLFALPLAVFAEAAYQLYLAVATSDKNS